MARAWTESEIGSIAGARSEWFDLPRIGMPSPLPIEVRSLASGESYETWLAAAPGAPRPEIVLRAARRTREELPVATEEEVAALELAPAGLGPQPLGLIEHTDPGGHCYPVMAESLVRGVVPAVSDWTIRLGSRIAGVLARLHAETWAAPGPVSTRHTNPVRRIDFAREIDGVVEHWSSRLGSRWKAWAPLVAPMRAYARSMTADIESVRDFALLHGDPNLTNILVAEGVPTLVDWEWAQIGDPARDLGFLGGLVHGAPWYPPLHADERLSLAQAYVDQGGRGDVADVASRAAAWLAAEGFSVSAYLLWVGESGRAAQKSWHTRTAAELTTSLADFLAPWRGIR